MRKQRCKRTLWLAANCLAHFFRPRIWRELSCRTMSGYDGNGYPNGLQGTRIPLEARVLAIADSLDAMMSWRAYREALPFSVVRNEVIRESGRQFDPSIVEVLVREEEFLVARKRKN